MKYESYNVDSFNDGMDMLGVLAAILIVILLLAGVFSWWMFL
jgi:hypothetical protein